MNIVLMGPPGCGKGTQAKRLELSNGMLQLSTGEMLRAAIAAGSPIGLKAKKVMDKGNLVSDDIVIAIIAERLDSEDTLNGTVFDGFPRTVAQAEALDRMFSDRNMELDAAILFKVEKDALVERITGRFTCDTCGKGYHDKFERPKVDGVCDMCGGTSFSRRVDDTAETVIERLDVYNAQTSPVVEYYRDKSVLRAIDGMADIAEVERQINEVLEDELAAGIVA